MGSEDIEAVTQSRDVLFRPFTVKSLTLKNRIVMSPMGQGHAAGGVPDPGYPAYYRRRAEGEVGARHQWRHGDTTSFGADGCQRAAFSWGGGAGSVATGA